MCVDVSNYERVRACISMLTCVCAYELESLVNRDTWIVSFLPQSSRPFLSPTLSNFIRLRLSAPIRSAAFRSPVRGNGEWRREPRSKKPFTEKAPFRSFDPIHSQVPAPVEKSACTERLQKCYNNVSMQLQL